MSAASIAVTVPLRVSNEPSIVTVAAEPTLKADTSAELNGTVSSMTEESRTSAMVAPACTSSPTSTYSSVIMPDFLEVTVRSSMLLSVWS